MSKPHFWKHTVCAYLVILIKFNEADIDNQPIVEISSGKLQGKVLKSRNGENYNAFLGIPFGQAERFEIAVIPQPWDGIYNATEFGAECVQSNLIKNLAVGSEACLFLNVYTPDLSPNGKFPVMVWLYPGGFSFGSSNLYPADYFMDEPVVLVSLNYRLGVFGFLDTLDGVVPGNVGLTDQRLALEWVQKNIEAFGGDSSLVTLFGNSAGSASVALHMLTDTSNLFHRAISESSTSLSAWLIQRNPKQNAQQLAKFLNCPSQSSTKLVDCLRLKTSTEIVNAVSQFKVGTTISDAYFLFTPSVNPHSKKAYLRLCPEQLLKDAKFSHEIPWMVGFSKNDGIMNLGSILEKESIIPEIVTNWTKIAPWLFVYNYDVGKPKSDEISLKIKEQFLLPYGKLDEKNFMKILAMLVGDRWEVSGTVKAMQGLGKKIPVYPFIFSYFGNFSYTNEIYGLKKRHGVGHMDELQYLFHALGAPFYNEDNELKHFSQELVKLWVEFARTGVPSTKTFKGWSPVQSDKPMQFYEIVHPDKSKMIQVDEDFKTRMQFWEGIAPPTCRLSSDTSMHSEL